jgi:hypothetical protein
LLFVDLLASFSVEAPVSGLQDYPSESDAAGAARLLRNIDLDAPYCHASRVRACGTHLDTVDEVHSTPAEQRTGAVNLWIVQGKSVPKAPSIP